MLFQVIVIPVTLLAAVAPFSRVGRDDLCVTNGAISTGARGKMSIETPSSRAVLRRQSQPSAEIRFRYLGPTSEAKPLASGAMRTQVGLKLRAKDSCNLLYVVWRIEPQSRIVISVKRNRGKHTHAECGAHGYSTVGTAPMPHMAAGESHTLRAELRGTTLSVFADNRRVWEGDAGASVMGFNGPVGVRTDNARVVFDYFARGLGNTPVPCKH